MYVLLPLLGMVEMAWRIHHMGLVPLPLPLPRALEAIAIIGMRAGAVTLVVVSLLLRARLAVLRPARS